MVNKGDKIIKKNNINNISLSGKCQICKIESTKRCSNCEEIYYCSPEHQKSDWKKHKQNCHPFKILNCEKYGRYLVANRNIKAGEIVLKENYIVRGPSQITGPVCVGCLQGIEENFKLECEKCGWPICSRKCQENDDHKYNECQLTVARGTRVTIQHFVSPHPVYQCLGTVRCLMLKERDPAKWSRLNQLESHCEQRRGSDQWRSDREGVAKFIPRFFKCEGRWTEEEILKITGLLQVNGHEVPLTEPSHVAVYDLSSMFEHSCLPNITKSFSKTGQVLFWAPNGIKTGTNLSICYTDALWGTKSRQQHLMQTKMFKCDCVRCTDVTEFNTFYNSIKCTTPEIIDEDGKVYKCDGLATPESLSNWDNDWTCLKCRKKISYSVVSNIIDRATKDVGAMEKSSESKCFKYLEYYSKLLSPQHNLICNAKVTLAQIIGSGGPNAIQKITDEKLNKKISLCREVLQIFEVLASAETRCLGLLEFELHSALAESGRRAALKHDSSYYSAIIESLHHAEMAIKLLCHEPIILMEGQIAAQAKINADSLKMMIPNM